MAEPRGISQLEWRTTDSAPVLIRFETAFGKLGRFSTTSEKSLRHCASGEIVSTSLTLLTVSGIPANSWSPGPPESQEAAHTIYLICDQRDGTPGSGDYARQLMEQNGSDRCACRKPRSLGHFSSVEATDQDHVARLGEARDGERPPVARPVEVANLASLETGQLKGRTPVERLGPDVIHTAGTIYVSDRLPIGRPTDNPLDDRRRKRKALDGPSTIEQLTPMRHAGASM